PAVEHGSAMSFEDRSLEYPRLRPVDAFPVEMQGQRVVCLRDPLNFSTHLVFLPQAALPIVAMFDGTHSVEQILAEFTRRTYQILPRQQLEKVITDLDASLFLDSERFRRYREDVESEFRTSPVRRAAHVGQAHDENPEDLRSRMVGFFSAAGVSHQANVG